MSIIIVNGPIISHDISVISNDNFIIGRLMVVATKLSSCYSLHFFVVLSCCDDSNWFVAVCGALLLIRRRRKTKRLFGWKSKSLCVCVVYLSVITREKLDWLAIFPNWARQSCCVFRLFSPQFANSETTRRYAEYSVCIEEIDEKLIDFTQSGNFTLFISNKTTISNSHFYQIHWIWPDCPAHMPLQQLQQY